MEIVKKYPLHTEYTTESDETSNCENTQLLLLTDQRINWTKKEFVYSKISVPGHLSLKC